MTNPKPKYGIWQEVHVWGDKTYKITNMFFLWIEWVYNLEGIFWSVLEREITGVKKI